MWGEHFGNKNKIEFVNKSRWTQHPLKHPWVQCDQDQTQASVKLKSLKKRVECNIKYKVKSQACCHLMYDLALIHMEWICDSSEDPADGDTAETVPAKCNQ